VRSAAAQPPIDLLIAIERSPTRSAAWRRVWDALLMPPPGKPAPLPRSIAAKRQRANAPRGRKGASRAPPRDAERPPPGDANQAAGAHGSNRQTRTTTAHILRYVDQLCTGAALAAHGLRAWTGGRDDATAARLTTEAFTLAMQAHALQAQLAEVLDCEAPA
jgi:hypothetical protein